jgi:glycopeptide antibiotics resistance protein
VLDRRWTLALRTALTVYLAAVLGLTTWPQLQQTSVPSWAEAVVRLAAAVGLPVTVGFLEAASNLVMFVPFGVLVLLLWWDARRRSVWRAGRSAWRLVGPVSAVAAAFSVAVELSQLVIPGRVSTVQDVVLNTAGALVGALVTAGVATVVGRRAAARAGGHAANG